MPTSRKLYTNEFILELARHPQNSAFLALIEALVLCDRCLVDHFTLLASDTCQRVLAPLKDVISPVYIPETDRLAVYDDLLGMDLKKNVKSALKEERNLLGRDYYHTSAANSKQIVPYTGFAGQYYDPSDKHKQQAISKGMYNPLNLGRTCFYMLLARQTGLPYLPHPWRERLLSAISGVDKPVSIAIVNLMTQEISVSVRDSVVVLSCSAKRHAKGGFRSLRPSLCYHRPVFFGCVRGAVLRGAATVGWIYGLVLICFGLTSTCCLPACIPLLIHWLKPEVKTYYGTS